MLRKRTRAIVAAIAVLAPATAIGGNADAAPPDPAQVGRFSQPFEEVGEKCVIDFDGRELCKPAGATVAALTTGRVLYWDALEGTENINLIALFEGAHQTRNDRSRILDLSTDAPRFRTPSPEDGGANQSGSTSEYLPGVPVSDPIVNDGDLFCSDQVQLSDGRVLAVGGTDYFAEPYVGSVQGTELGLIELEGTKAARIFDPYNETWTQSGSMHYGRWYPSLVTLANGDLFVASGVTKLVKPMYPDRPMDSGTNVKQTETFDTATGTWTVNPPSANRSLPLYPRLHLLPNGHVYYDAGGQVFNPMGQSYDEAFWNIAATYDPEAQRWTDLGVPGLGLGALPGLPDIPDIDNGDLAGVPLLDAVPLDGLPMAGGDLTGIPGFRGSAFSIMLPLRPGAGGAYRAAEFLSAGGILGTTPGTYLATASSQVNTVTIAADGSESLSSRATGPLTTPRWYGTGVLLPTGEVMAFSGADKDEVLLPGTGVPVTTPELWDPATETWSPMAPQGRARTYHNAATLLPDGRVLVGGHAPIPTLYGFNVTVPGMSPNEGRDPSFEIFAPPYLFRGDRPTIAAVDGRIDSGTTFRLRMGSTDEATAVASEGGSVVLMRNTAITHLVDSDQRAVELPVVGREGSTLIVQAPPDPAVAPPGPYLLFANRPSDDGPIPSVSAQVFVDAPVPASLTPWRATAPGQPSAPIEPEAPEAVFMENLQDFLGFGSIVPTSASGAVGFEAGTPAADTGTVDPVDAPVWLLVVAAGLPLAVLSAAPTAVRRRPIASRRPG